MDFARRSEAWPELEPHHRTHANRIAGWTYQAHAQSRFGGDILKQTGGRAVLRHDQVNPSVLIKISQCRAALLAEHFDARLLTRHCPQLSRSVALQPQAEAGVQAWRLRL